MTSEIDKGCHKGVTEDYNAWMQVMTPDIHKGIQASLRQAVSVLVSKYEAWDATVLPMKYGDGGWRAIVMLPTMQFGPLPHVLDEYRERVGFYAQKSFYHEQTGECPQDRAEVNAYFDKLLNTETALEEDVDEYINYESAFMLDYMPYLFLSVEYFDKDNPRSRYGFENVLVRLDAIGEQCSPSGNSRILYGSIKKYLPVDEYTEYTVRSVLLEQIDKMYTYKE